MGDRDEAKALFERVCVCVDCLTDPGPDALAAIRGALTAAETRGRLAGLREAAEVCRISKITARNKGTDATDEAVQAIRKLIEETENV